MNIFTKQTHRHREQSCSCQGREGVGERHIKSLGMSRCKLLYTGWINKVPLCSTRNYIQYPVVNHNGKEYERICMYITESLCWAGQTPLSMGILQARILEWVDMPSSEDLPDPAIECSSILAPALQADSLSAGLPGKPDEHVYPLLNNRGTGVWRYSGTAPHWSHC